MLAIRVGQVFDGAGVLPGVGVVFVDGTRIIGMAGPDAPLPWGCTVLDRPGATLLPGLIDVHVHLVGDATTGTLGRLPECSPADLARTIENSLRITLAAGVTSVRDLGDRDWAVLRWRAARPDAALPTIVAAGPPITVPQGHCWYMGGVVDSEMALRAAVRERAERGADVVKIMASGGLMTEGTDVTADQFTAAELALVVAEAHVVGLPVTAHAHALSSIRNAVAAGVDGIEHCTFLTADGFVYDAATMADLAASGVAVCPTFGTLEGHPVPPVIVELMERSGQAYADRFAWAGTAHAAGVRLVSGTDGGITPAMPHGGLALAVAHLVVGGVPVVAALASATSVAAQVCGLTRKGRIRAGFDADLLLVDGDPLTDVAALARVDTVVLRGHIVPPTFNLAS